MKESINVLVTGAGAPGIRGTLYSLYNNYDGRKVSVVGTDMSQNAVGKYWCDSFYIIPKALYKSQSSYLNSLLKICKKEKIDVLLPQNTAELCILAENKSLFENTGVRVAISGKGAIDTANNKYNLITTCKTLGIPYPETYQTETMGGLKKYAKRLGWPNNKIVIKPPISNGSRGLRIIDENINLKRVFFEEKPNNTFCTMHSLEEVLGLNFPPLLISEYMPGDEYTVDAFRSSNKFLAIPRIRQVIKNGITFVGKTVKEERLIEYSKKIAEKINLEFCFGFQFKLDNKGVPKILECNPRIQGTMVASTFAGANIIYSSVKSCLGESIPNMKPRYNTRIFRYWGAVGVNKEVVTI